MSLQEEFKQFIVNADQSRVFFNFMQSPDPNLIQEVHNDPGGQVRLFEGDQEYDTWSLRHLINYYETDIRMLEKRVRSDRPRAILHYLGEKLETYRSDHIKIKNAFEVRLKGNKWYLLPNNMVAHFVAEGEWVIKIKNSNYWACADDPGPTIDKILAIHLKDKAASA